MARILRRNTLNISKRQDLMANFRISSLFIEFFDFMDSILLCLRKFSLFIYSKCATIFTLLCKLTFKCFESCVLFLEFVFVLLQYFPYLYFRPCIHKKNCNAQLGYLSLFILSQKLGTFRPWLSSGTVQVILIRFDYPT